jgi:regulator of replication initiation timing
LSAQLNWHKTTSAKGQGEHFHGRKVCNLSAVRKLKTAVAKRTIHRYFSQRGIAMESSSESSKMFSALLADVKSQAGALVAERDRLKLQIEALQLRITEHEARAEAAETSQAPDEAPATRERIRSLVDEIDACIAMIPQRQQTETTEHVTA